MTSLKRRRIMTFQALCESLEGKIQDSYTTGVTLEEAEKLAGEFLHALIKVSSELKNRDLDARMKKSGVKSIRAAIYLDILQKNEKKPTEAAIGALIDSDKIVLGEQTSLDQAEVDRDELERYYSIFQNAHIFYRGIARGKFE
jgi:hypothetical protein